jgi:hypothetical protein
MNKWIRFLSALTLFFALTAGASPNLESVARITDYLKETAQTEKRILTLDEVLFEIGHQFPELRSNYILMHESRSRQEASYEFPRVIAFTDDARFVLTFNGDPNARGYYEIEMYEFKGIPFNLNENPLDVPLNGMIDIENYQSEGFHFQRIVFEPSPDYPHKRAYAAEKSFPVLRPINEALCQGCHSKNPRPNWEAYNRWEGAYFPSDRIAFGEKYLLGYMTPEHEGFDLFYTRQAHSGRYRFLLGLNERFVLPVKHLSRIAESQFTQVAGYLNYRRIAHLILQSKDYATYRFAILGALYGCEDFESFIPPSVRAKIKETPEYFTDLTRKLFDRDINEFHLRSTEGWLGKLRYLMEGRDIPMHRWSMSFRRSQYAFVTPGGSPNGFISSILMEYDKDLSNYRVFTLSGDGFYYITTNFLKRWTGSMRTMVASECTLLKQESCKMFSQAGFLCPNQ